MNNNKNAGSDDKIIDRIRIQLISNFHPMELDIADDFEKHIGHRHMGDGHFSVRIVAPVFSEQPLLQRHRMIYAALENLLQTDIHALSIKALAPGELR